jgi:hypothetical protein
MLPTTLVFSPVPATNDLGMEMVNRQWKSLQNRDNHTYAHRDDGAGNETLNGDGELTMKNTTDPADDHPIVIPYLTSVALAIAYPVEQELSYYIRIADIIDEDSNAD